MRLTKFKKYITWNLLSLIGYACICVMIVFLLMLMVASSGTTIRPDINEIFYDYIVKHLIVPYIKFYRFQIFIVALLMLLSVGEHRYYVVNEQFGLRLFDNHEKAYSFVFVLGISLNFVPLYIITMVSILWLIRFI